MRGDDIWYNTAMKAYKIRIVDDLLARKLRGMGAVNVTLLFICVMVLAVLSR